MHALIFVITCMISDQIELNSDQLPILIESYQTTCYIHTNLEAFCSFHLVVACFGQLVLITHLPAVPSLKVDNMHVSQQQNNCNLVYGVWSMYVCTPTAYPFKWNQLQFQVQRRFEGSNVPVFHILGTVPGSRHDGEITHLLFMHLLQTRVHCLPQLTVPCNDILPQEPITLYSYQSLVTVTLHHYLL